MQILKATGGIAETNCWLIADETSGKAVLFDAPNDTTRPLLHSCGENKWDLVGLWLTHGHFDHLADHAVVTSRYPNAKVLIHRGDLDKITGRYPILFPLPFTIPARQPDGFLEEGQKLKIGSIDVEVLHVPGHAAGHVVFHLPQERVLVGGDMIICDAIGRIDLPDSDDRQMRDSIKRIMALPEETTLLPGHGEASTLGREHHSNCMVREILAGR